MSERRRYYLTTAIAYANNAPGLHTVYEVIGADVIARWHRMLGDDTRFLTGTDEHSREHRPVGRGARAGRRASSSTRRSRCSGRPRTRCSSAPTGSSARPTPTTTVAAQEMVRRAYANGDIYLGTYEGWYCPNEGFKATVRPARDGARDAVPQPPRRRRSSGSRSATGSSACRRTRTACSSTTRQHPDFVQPDYRRNEMLGFIRGGLEDFSISRAGATLGDPVPDRRERRDRPARGRVVGPGGGHDLRLVRRADQLHHRGGLPRRPRRVPPLVAGRPPRHRQGHRPVPHDLLAGDAVVGRASRRRATSGSTAS